jgi:hypothetical protein
MCLWRAPEKYITGTMAPVGAALDRAGVGDPFVFPVAEEGQTRKECEESCDNSADTVLNNTRKH